MPSLMLAAVGDSTREEDGGRRETGDTRFSRSQIFVNNSPPPPALRWPVAFARTSHCGRSDSTLQSAHVHSQRRLARRYVRGEYLWQPCTQRWNFHITLCDLCGAFMALFYNSLAYLQQSSSSSVYFSRPTSLKSLDQLREKVGSLMSQL